jgi:hypothetical protein
MSNPLPSMPPGRPAAIPVPASSGLWDRLSNWVSENKAVVYTIAGVAVVVTGAGVVYYLSDSVRPARLSVLRGRLVRRAVATTLGSLPQTLSLIRFIHFTEDQRRARRRGGSERKPSAKQPTPSPRPLPPSLKKPPYRASPSCPRSMRRLFLA